MAQQGSWSSLTPVMSMCGLRSLDLRLALADYETHCELTEEGAGYLLMRFGSGAQGRGDLTIFSVNDHSAIWWDGSA